MTTQTSHQRTITSAWAGVGALAFGASAVAQSASPPVAGRPDAGATTTTTTGAQPLTTQPGTAPPPASPFGGPGFMLMIGAFVVLMIVMQTMTGKKDKKRRSQMLASLKRHDRVTTIGGLIGSIAEVRDDEIILKVDEATNTKVRVVPSAIQAVLKKSPSASDEPALEAARS